VEYLKGCFYFVLLQRVAVDGSRYGQLDYGTIWTGNMGCSGTESHVRFCSKITQAFGHNTACNHNNSAGVICSSKLRLELLDNFVSEEFKTR
jgi:hypothetical protein